MTSAHTTGAYTYWMARRVGPTGQVFAFEPQPELAAALDENVSRRFGPTVTVERKALSHAAGVATLLVPSRGPSPGATLEPRDWPLGSQVSVPTVTLDGYFEEHPPRSTIALIKCDVEGHELEVFRGGSRTLDQHRPVLMFECEARHRADGRIETVFAHLEGLGYRGYYFGRDGRLCETGADRSTVGAGARVNNFVFLSKTTAPASPAL